jgi:DNA-binding response OmpR family regulator
MARILVMDDDALVRHSLRALLEAAGYDVIEAADGKAGLRLHGEQGADLVIVDISMPEQDGLEVIRTLRTEIPRPKIVAISGGGQTARSDMLTVAAAFGASRTLRKPFEPRELLAVIRDLLGER